MLVMQKISIKAVDISLPNWTKQVPLMAVPFVMLMMKIMMMMTIYPLALL